MKKILPFCAMIIGAFSLLIGSSSCCSKDDEQCCEWIDDYGEDYRACENDALVQSTESWGYVLYSVQYYGGNCD